MFDHQVLPSLSLDGEGVIFSLCWTTDLDYFFHMNNGKYFREMDFARWTFLCHWATFCWLLPPRFDFYFRTGCSAYIEARPQMFVVQHGASIRYRRFVKPCQLMFVKNVEVCCFFLKVCASAQMIWFSHKWKVQESKSCISSLDAVISVMVKFFCAVWIPPQKSQLSRVLDKQDRFWSHVTPAHMQRLNSPPQLFDNYANT